ncbi:MAG: hypothetical protein K6F34_01785 [Lachnospiraceae bacterium]|nr:hypothetical protein [Lachnospiraceae bacterium]
MFLKLNNALRLQYEALFRKLDENWKGDEIFIIEDDLMMAVGKPECLVLSLADGGFSKQEPFEPEDIANMEEPKEIEEGTLQNEVLKYVLMRLRKVLDIKPLAPEHMLEVLRTKLNDQLKFFDITDPGEKDGTVVDMRLRGGHGTIEDIIFVLEDESVIVEVLGDVDMDYLRRLVGLGRFGEALEIFRGLYERSKPGSMFNTEVNMYLGELYYHLDMLDKSADHYRQCNHIYITDMKDYRIRLGHSLIDDKAGLRAGLIKMYYRCMLNTAYKKSLGKEYDKLVVQVEPVYAAHEAQCEAAGALG